MNSERLAIQLMIAQAVLFAAETTIIHQIGASVSVMQLALIRGAGGLALAFAFARTVVVIRTRQLTLQLLRGAVSLLYLWVMIYSFGHLPLADATAISYTQAAYIAVFSVLILHEPVTRSCWAAAVVGIIGALLIAKPALADWSGAYLIALGGTALNGLAFVLNRYLQREDTEATTMFYTNVVLVLGNLPVLALAGLPPPETIPWLPGLLLFGPVGMYLGIVAARYANAAMLGPFTLVRLLIGVLAGVIVFNEPPDIFTGVGVALIAASCVLSSCLLPNRDRLLRRLCMRHGGFPSPKGVPTI